nr:uncharacterized protein LOC107434580 [Ziziphus jujuba var. spinosa]
MHGVQLKIMVNLEIEIVLPPRSEEKMDTRKTNEAESKEKEKDEIQIEEDEEAGRKQLEKPVMVSSDKKKPSKNEGGFANMMEDFNNLNLLVATIIATAAFAAVFAMPGGYNDQGVPILYKSKEFQHFLRFDQLLGQHMLR